MTRFLENLSPSRFSNLLRGLPSSKTLETISWLAKLSSVERKFLAVSEYRLKTKTNKLLTTNSVSLDHQSNLLSQEAKSQSTSMSSIMVKTVETQPNPFEIKLILLPKKSRLPFPTKITSMRILFRKSISKLWIRKGVFLGWTTLLNKIFPVSIIRV